MGIERLVKLTVKGALPVSGAAEKSAAILDEWSAIAGREGYIVRSLTMDQELGESLSGVCILQIVRVHGKESRRLG